MPLSSSASQYSSSLSNINDLPIIDSKTFASIADLEKYVFEDGWRHSMPLIELGMLTSEEYQFLPRDSCGVRTEEGSKILSGLALLVMAIVGEL